MKILKTGGIKCFEDLPIQINWNLTQRCNYHCSYCFYYGKSTPPQLPFSTLEQMRIAVDNIASLNRPWYDVFLSGGEPTIHPHIFDLIYMLHEKLGERLNRLSIITNGSRNKSLYGRIIDVAKYTKLNLKISIHTDHVKMDHILELIENLSADIDISFSLMFNPDKREFVHEIYDTMFEYRKKYQFSMNVVTIRDRDIVDPRYTQEDFDWQKQAIKKFNDLAKSVSAQFPPRKKAKNSDSVVRIIEDNGEIKTVKSVNRTVELASGLFRFKGMYCISHAVLLRVFENGDCKGMVCPNDKNDCNIFNEGSLMAYQDKLIHFVRCNQRNCGCAANDPIPKFALEEDAKKYVEFAQKRQAELFNEYFAAQTMKTL